MKPTERAFAALCFLVLMDHHGTGYKEAHPRYIDEKSMMLSMGYDAAFSMLDGENQDRVITHLKDWGYSIPEGLAESV
jgi:hypothetical protein